MLLGSGNGTVADVRIAIVLWSDASLFGGQPVSASLDDFSATYQEIYYLGSDVEPVPESGSCFGGLALAAIGILEFKRRISLG